MGAGETIGARTARACNVAIRPFPNDTELRCERAPDGHETHRATLRDYAYPGSVTDVEWLDGDRRSFEGDWPGRCDAVGGCVLPAGHHGACAA